MTSQRWASPELWNARAGTILDFANWETYVTLTTAEPTTAGGVAIRFRRWARDIARKAFGGHYALAYGIEDDSDFAHVHALFAGLDDAAPLDLRLADAYWRADARNGFTRIEPYDAADRGAAFYVAKNGNWGLGVVCPRRSACRRKGCTRGLTPYW